MGNGRDPNRAGVQIGSNAKSNVIGTNGDGLNDVAERNLISGNHFDGIQITGASNVVAGNFIGIDRTGTAALSNGTPGSVNSNGILVTGGSNRIGTNGDGIADAAERNVISGNLFDGVRINRATATYNVVAGNFIGTDVTGTVGMGNSSRGVELIGGAQLNVIGTNGDGVADDDERNVLSDNVTGVYIVGDLTDNNVVAGNFIGTNANGSAALGNRTNGVVITSGAANNVIGTNGDGTGDAAERNVISANGNDGVHLTGTGTDFNVIAGNLIGTDVTGTQPLGNGAFIASDDGVSLRFGPRFNRIGTDGNGVSDALERNVIAANSGAGILILDPGTDNNVVAGNLIGTDITGTVALGNNNGINLGGGAQGNLIGTKGDGAADAAERNVISGNAIAGVDINGAGTDNNVIAGNYIGVDVTGANALGNGTPGQFIAPGVIIEAGAQRNRIGTNGDGLADAAERNVVSGNVARGIVITDAGTDHNVVAGNFVGTDALGTVAVANGVHGVEVRFGAKNNLIGTDGDGVADAAERNVISGNALDGVSLYGAGTGQNSVAGNYIGTDVTGTNALGNGGPECRSTPGLRGNLIGTNGDVHMMTPSEISFRETLAMV